MKNYSIWREGVTLDSFNKLDKDISVDVLIIGGGLTGVSSMYHLRDSGLKVALVEQNKVGMGVTVNSTAKVTYLQENLYNEILKNFDFETASLYLDSQREAMNLVVSIIKDNNIECDLEKTNSYVYTDKDSEIIKLKELKSFLEKNNIKVTERSVDLVKSKYMIGVDDTYLFHPLKFIDGLLKKCNYGEIYEDTSVKKIEKENGKYVCYTSGAKIVANFVVIASHYPYFNLPLVFPIKGKLEKSYVSASNKKLKNVSLISYYKPVVSIRSYKDYMIYLELSDNLANNVKDGDNFKLLTEKVSKKYGVEPEYLWSNIDIITNDSLPYVGAIEDKMYIGTGYNTWGMTNGVLAGRIISDLILKKKNRYVELFNPKRVNGSMFSNAVIDGYYNMVGYVKGYFLDDENVRYEYLDGREIAIYKDENGEHKVYTKCPHLGCRLNFNQEELTWDCPCHASRFDIDGKVINGPSNYDISVKD